MLIPRYYFAQDYAELHDYFLTIPHRRRMIHKGEFLWKPGKFIEHVYYIESGISQTLVEHEDGYQKILFFHSSGTVFPGCHESLFKIEKSIITKALSDMEVLEFTRTQFHQMIQENMRLNAIVLESYAMYINLLIYETAHQEYNNSFIKLCNLLYLFSQNSPEGRTLRISLSQEDIANILTINRVNAAKNLSRLRNEGIIRSHRKWIEIIDIAALEAYCSMETRLS